MSLVTAPIKDFSLGIYDGPHATPKEATEGHIFLGIKNVTPEGRFDFSQINYVSDEEFLRWTKPVTPKAGDVVFSYEATLHRYAVIPEGFDGCLGRRMGLVRPDTTKLLPRYLHYYFLSPVWQRYLETKVITGATVNRLPIKDFPDFLINVPNIDEQKNIVETLSSYDDLIENNRRRIQLLEESARLLYQEWFVHLRFPGHERVKVVDGVPEGWKKNPLGNVVTLHYGKALKAENRVTGDFPVYGSSGIVGTHEKALAHGPAIIIGRKGNVGSTFWMVIDKTFEALLKLADDLNNEESRAVRKGLNEETLVLFDMLKKPELAKKDIAAIKKVCFRIN
nr:restriction endonuclease subunit S [Endozoicomonas sp.]